MSTNGITQYHACYFAHELTRRCPSYSLEKLAATLADAQVDLNPHQIDAALFAFRSPLSRGAILADEVGLGKTHLLAGLYDYFVHKNYTSVFFKKELELVEYLKHNNFKGIADDLREKKVVMIDDLGKVKLAEWEVEKFFAFYDYISSNRILLQVTTNMTTDEIAAEYGGAIADRLYRNDKCKIMNIRRDKCEEVTI